MQLCVCVRCIQEEQVGPACWPSVTATQKAEAHRHNGNYWLSVSFDCALERKAITSLVAVGTAAACPATLHCVAPCLYVVGAELMTGLNAWLTVFD